MTKIWFENEYNMRLLSRSLWPIHVKLPWRNWCYYHEQWTERGTEKKKLKSVTVQQNTKELHAARFARNGSSLFVSLRLEMETSGKKQNISTITPAVVLHVPFSPSEFFVTPFNSLSLFCMSSQGRPPIDGEGKKKNTHQVFKIQLANATPSRPALLQTYNIFFPKKCFTELAGRQWSRL